MKYSSIFMSIVYVLICLLSDTSFAASQKMFFSKRYVPLYNPGGDSFNSDVDFVKSYNIYEKRRRIFSNHIDKSSNVSSQKNSSHSKEEISKKLSRYGIIPKKSKKVSELKPGAMVNSKGIDISRLKGAKFVKIDDSGWNLPVNASDSTSKILNERDRKDDLVKNALYSERLKNKIKVAYEKDSKKFSGNNKVVFKQNITPSKDNVVEKNAKTASSSKK